MKKKALPLWIREGLEKLERKKQKQEQEDDNEPKKSTVNLSASGSSTIAGYDHGKVHSPIRSPKSNDSDEVQCTNKSLHLAQMGQIIRTNMQYANQGLLCLLYLKCFCNMWVKWLQLAYFSLCYDATP